MATNGVMIGARAEYDRPTIKMNRWLANWKKRRRQFKTKPICSIMRRGLRIADCGLSITTLWIAFKHRILWVVDYGPRIAYRGLRIADCGSQIVDCKLWTAVRGLQIADRIQVSQIVGSGLRITDRVSWIEDCGLWIADCGSRTADGGPRMADQRSCIL